MGRLDILRRSPHGTDARRTAAADPAVLASAFALVLVMAYLLAPTMGVDLSAQLARADFARHDPLTPVDLRWFGGTFAYGYSLWVPAVAGLVGAELLGAIAAVVGTWFFTRLLQAVKARRPLAGGLAAAFCQAANLVEGRVAFGVGLACGLGALLALQRGRRTAMVIGAVLTGAANPVAALLLWLCAAVAAVHRRWVDAALLVVGSGLPLLVISGVFSDGGNEPFGRSDFGRALVASILVALVIPLRYKAIRIGAVLGIVFVSAAYFVHSPVGSNATRLSLLFAIPLVIALVEFRRPVTIAIIAIAVVVQLPLTVGTLRDAGAPATTASYYQPLLAEIGARGPITGRVEIPEMVGHWDAYFVARSVPIARGWLRQVDTDLNGPVFYQQGPTAASYRGFLDTNAVEYVAVPDARLSTFGQREATAIPTFSYLSPVWSNAHWTLYAVAQSVPIVAAPATLTGYTASQLLITAPPHTTVAINLRWSRWLTVNTGCLRQDGKHAALETGPATRYVVGSTLVGAHHC